MNNYLFTSDHYDFSDRYYFASGCRENILRRPCIRIYPHHHTPALLKSVTLSVEVLVGHGPYCLFKRENKLSKAVFTSSVITSFREMIWMGLNSINLDENKALNDSCLLHVTGVNKKSFRGPPLRIYTDTWLHRNKMYFNYRLASAVKMLIGNLELRFVIDQSST